MACSSNTLHFLIRNPAPPQESSPLWGRILPPSICIYGRISSYIRPLFTFCLASPADSFFQSHQFHPSTYQTSHIYQKLALTLPICLEAASSWLCQSTSIGSKLQSRSRRAWCAHLLRSQGSFSDSTPATSMAPWRWNTSSTILPACLPGSRRLSSRAWTFRYFCLETISDRLYTFCWHVHWSSPRWRLCWFLRCRTTIITGCGIFFVGIALKVASTSYGLLIAGRLIAGIGVGFVSAIVILYMSETAPRKVQGMIVSGYQFCITLGLLLSSCVVYGTQGFMNSRSYRIPMPIQWVWALVLGKFPLGPPSTTSQPRNESLLTRHFRRWPLLPPRIPTLVIILV